MSMLSAQADRLRLTADVISERGVSGGDLAIIEIRLREAADTIISLRDRLQDAELGRGTCKPTEEDYCPICGKDLVKCNVGIGELGGAVELDPPIYHNYCPSCGAKVVER